MRPLRFPGRFRWWIVAVLAVIFGFPLFHWRRGCMGDATAATVLFAQLP